ncbi:MAG: 16S rRNA (guanine(527)-N(7))-methyltransferase RsmG [Granulosicoccus sp.]
MSEQADLEYALNAGLEHLHQRHNVAIDAANCPLLLQYVTLLLKWNRVYNLTAVREPRAMVERHLLDSLVLCRWLPATSIDDEARVDVVDIGSGAGLPVLPLAIARPDLSFASIESNGKKTRFQQQALVELGLGNVRILNQRVQDISLQACFVTSRAFTAPTEFLKIAQQLCSEQALVAIMLAHSDKLPDPLPASFSLQELVPVDIPGNCAPRHIALCRRNP